MKRRNKASRAKNAVLSVLSAPARGRGYVSTRMANFCRYYLRVYENCNWEFAKNGEEEALRRLTPVAPSVIFDVGAHEGTWSDIALKCFPTATIHAFEIAPPTAIKLSSHFSQTERVVVNAIGLGESAGSVEVIYFPGHADNTLIPPAGQPLPADARRLLCEVETGDGYCLMKAITHIDFCKIDVEGFEYNVIKGFSSMLSSKSVDVVQF
jgi:FkbM family methyltransferase